MVCHTHRVVSPRILLFYVVRCSVFASEEFKKSLRFKENASFGGIGAALLSCKSNVKCNIKSLTRITI